MAWGGKKLREMLQENYSYPDAGRDSYWVPLGPVDRGLCQCPVEIRPNDIRYHSAKLGFRDRSEGTRNCLVPKSGSMARVSFLVSATGYHGPDDEPVAPPLDPEFFEFDLHKDDISREQLKELLYDEIMSFRPAPIV
ncbi:hypothetical protein CPB85DRAFT_1449455 [Mucidula mucida]|nr:hypothetical protein CPB85DRAFT_1449455 [Mucidula mucida]